MNFEVRYSIILNHINRQSAAIPAFIIRHSLFDIRYSNSLTVYLWYDVKNAIL